jgi:hypothetical protein
MQAAFHLISSLINYLFATHAYRDTPLVPAEELPELLKAVPAWSLNPERTMLTRKFTARNFMAAMAFFNKLAEVAESQGHHPDFHLRNYRCAGHKTCIASCFSISKCLANP